MEQRIMSKVNDHQIHFKTDIGEWLKRFNSKVMRGDEDVTAAFLQYVYSHKGLTFTEEDFQKRKRTAIPMNERCIAKRSNNEQCSRRRKFGCFCGTHTKGAPYGVISEMMVDKQETKKKVEIRTVDIGGIYYYVDCDKNVYSPEDIVSQSTSPKIIGKYENDCFLKI